MERVIENSPYEKVFKTFAQVVLTASIAWCLSFVICSTAFAQVNNQYPSNLTQPARSGSNVNVSTMMTAANRFLSTVNGKIGMVPFIGNIGTSRYGKLRWNAAVGIPGLGTIAFGNGGMGGSGYWDQGGILEGLLCRVLALPEGGFGALVMIIAGLAAVVAAAIGMYRLALATVVVGVGSWLIYPVMTLFFGEACWGL